MDDMEKKEKLEQSVAEESAVEEAETAEKTEEVEKPEVTEETKESVPEEPVTERAQEMKTEKPAEKGGSNILGIVVGLAVFIAFLALVWMAPVGSMKKDNGVFYAKENDLYFYDMKNEPYLVQKNIANGGGYHYFYSAWGAGVAEEGDDAYYMANIDASGEADLYHLNTTNPAAKPECIDKNVCDYKVSKNGKVVAYLAMEKDSLRLRVNDGKNNVEIAEGLHLEDDVYSLSADGKYLVYTDAYDMLCAVALEDGTEAVKLTEDCPLYALAEDTGILYFVSKTDDVYNIFSYDFKEEPVLVAEDANYMELMPNGRDLLYGLKPTEIIPYSDILVDDMAEIDAEMKKDDKSYEQKLMRDEIRKAMKNGEGIAPLMTEYYLYSGGKATLVADNVISAIAVKDSKTNFVTGYKAKDFQPIYLSVIGGGLEMVESIYYMSLNYGGLEPFLADGSGKMEILTGAGVLLDTVKISSDGNRAAYLLKDENTGGNILMQMEIGKAEKATAVQMNVEDYAFLGGNGPLCYYYEYVNGAGTLAVAGNEKTISNATGVHFADDTKAVYYIKDVDGKTGVGQMQYWDGKAEPVVVDDGAFAFQYKGNGKVAIIYQYDVAKQVGNLGYYDSKNVTMLDEDVTALYIY